MLTIRKISMPTKKVALKCPYKMTPTRIVIHNTANDASAYNEIKYMQSNLDHTSFHFAVDDQEAVQGCELTRATWNAGDGINGTGNRKGIAIEICYSLSGGDKWLKAVDNAAELTAKLLKEYGWGISKVTKHQDYNKKYCPHRILSEYGWDNFLALVEDKLGTNTVKTVTKTTTKTTTKTESFFPAKGYFSKGDVHENVGKIAAYMYKVFPSYTSKKALGTTYGTYLIKAVKEFQKRTGLETDGNFGPLTLAKLESFGFKY